MHLLTPELQQEIKSKAALLAVLAALFVIFSFLSSLSPQKSAANISATPQAGTGQITSGDYKSRIAFVSEEVNPTKGIQTKIILGDAVPKMVALGIIDMDKIKALYKNRGGIPPEEMKMLTEPSNVPLTIKAGNAVWLVNLLWPLGLANKMDVNNQSPVAGANVNGYASTGGWSLGQAATGGGYFNKYTLVPLTPAQEQRVLQLAQSTYRPCCDNSSFFQDCNHGSAAMAIIELGVSQNLSDADIYQTLLAFNSFWFPQNYVETALYFNIVKGVDWKGVDPKTILGKDYSSLSGWTKNVDTPVQKIPGLIPQSQNGASCGT